MRGFAAGGAIAGAGALAMWAVRGRAASVFGPSVHRGAGSRGSVALTFDDGPSPGTIELLEILNEHRVPATFFVCGQNVERRPEIARTVALAGHEIGNHSWSHPHFWLRSPGAIAGELRRTQEILLAVTGRAPSLFRAPFGARWFGLRRIQRELNLMGVMWTVIGQDWKLPADGIAKRVLQGASPGGIICLHDGRNVEPDPDVRPTLDAVRRLIPELHARGFAFETVSQILCPTH